MLEISCTCIGKARFASYKASPEMHRMTTHRISRQRWHNASASAALPVASMTDARLCSEAATGSDSAPNSTSRAFRLKMTISSASLCLQDYVCIGVLRCLCRNIFDQEGTHDVIKQLTAHLALWIEKHRVTQHAIYVRCTAHTAAEQIFRR